MKTEYFANQLLIENVRPQTLRNYKISINELKKNMANSEAEPTKEDVVNYLARLQQENYQSSSIARHLAAIKKYFLLVLESDLKIKSPKKQLTQKIYLTKTELKKILEKASKYEKTLIQVYYDTGARFDELAQSNKTDYDPKTGKIKTIGKGGIPAYLYFTYFPKETAQLLEQSFQNRKDKNPALLVGTYGGRLSNSTLNYILRDLCKKCKITKKVHAHILRKTVGQHILEDTGDIFLASKKLRHKNVGVTQTSYADYSDDQVQKILGEKISPGEN